MVVFFTYLFWQKQHELITLKVCPYSIVSNFEIKRRTYYFIINISEKKKQIKYKA